MKLVAMHEAKAKLSEYIAASQKDRVLITNHGRPAAIVIGVEGEDLEDLMTRANPKFWEMIEEVRKQPTLSLAEAKKYFTEADEFETKHGRPMSPATAKKVVSGTRAPAPTKRGSARRRKKASP
jgi:prevent-host-death family protein